MATLSNNIVPGQVRWFDLQHPTCRNTSQQGGQTRTTCSAQCSTQRCYDMLPENVAIAWPRLVNAGPIILQCAPIPHFLTSLHSFATNTVCRHPCGQTLWQRLINNLIPHESMGWQGIPGKKLRTTTNCAHTSLTDDTSAGLKCFATVRVCSTLAASRRLFLAGSDFSSALACWYVSFPSAIYSKNNNKRNLHFKTKKLVMCVSGKEEDNHLTNTACTITEFYEERYVFFIFIKLQCSQFLFQYSVFLTLPPPRFKVIRVF